MVLAMPKHYNQIQTKAKCLNAKVKVKILASRPLYSQRHNTAVSWL